MSNNAARFLCGAKRVLKYKMTVVPKIVRRSHFPPLWRILSLHQVGHAEHSADTMAK